MEEFAAVLRAASERLEGLQGSDPVRWYDLLRIVLTWVWWRRPIAEQGTLLDIVQTHHDATRQQHLQKLREEMGIITREEEVYLKGQVKSAWECLLEVLEVQHGGVPAELLQRIEVCDDLPRLRNAFQRVLRGQPAEDLFQ